MPEALFGLLVVLVVAAMLAAVVRLGVGLADSAGARRVARQREASRWAVVHHADPRGGTLVCVALLSPDGVELDRRPVRRVDDADPAFDEAFLEAVLAAQARAALFQSAAGASLPHG